MIDERMRSGTKAATTITSGKNETNAFPASATLRSTNSISSMRSHTRQSSSRSSRVPHGGNSLAQPSAALSAEAVMSCAEVGSSSRHHRRAEACPADVQGVGKAVATQIDHRARADRLSSRRTCE